MIIVRAIFCTSVGTTLFWGLGFAAERIAGAEPPFWTYAVPSLLLTTACAIGLFRVRPQFLAPKRGDVGPFLFSAVLWTVLAYVAGVIGVGVLADLYLNPRDAAPEFRGETVLAVYLLAVWFPLWFAPAVGLAVSWRRYMSRVNAL